MNRQLVERELTSKGPRRGRIKGRWRQSRRVTVNLAARSGKLGLRIALERVADFYRIS
jgi:hypothetical protein